MRTKLLTIGLVLAVVALVGGAGLTYPAVEQDSWYLMRTVATNDTALTGATRVWTDCKATFMPVHRDWERAFLGFLAYGDGDGAGDPENGTFSYAIYSVRSNGSAQLVANGTCSVGSLQASHDPVAGQLFSLATYKWAERPVMSLDAWRTNVCVSGTNDDMGNLSWRTYHDFGIYCTISDMVGITSVSVYVSGDKD